MKYPYSSFKKATSSITLVAFLLSIFSPLGNITFAGVPDLNISYSSNPARAGDMTITVVASEPINSGATISIDQPGNMDISDALLTDLGTGTIFTYTYTVNQNDGSSYVDGVANVSLSGVTSQSTGDQPNPPTGTTFTIDTTAPIVSLSGSSTVDVEYGSVYVDDGADWTDNVDGSGNTLVGNYGDPSSFALSGTVNTGAIGTYYVEYLKVDAAGNTGSVTRTVNVVDTTAPTATVSYSTLATTSGSVIATLTGASEAITITNNGGLSTYTFANNGSFTFNFSDISGNTGSVTATVNNIDTTAPVITLVGSNPTTIAQGSVYVDSGATATDVVAGNLTSSITSSGTVNTSIIGSYSVTYTVSDTAGNTATAVRTVNVIVATPITTTGGGGGGGGSSSYGVSSSPNSTSSSISSSSANSSMSLGLAALQRILNNSINSSEQSSETSHSNTTTDIIVSDIDTSYAKEEIIILIEKGYVRNAEKFDPTRKMTRGEFIKILSLANDFVEMDDTEIQFKDVATGSDFEKYIKFGVAMGWVNPNQEKFRPNDAITLGEVMKLLNAVNGTGNAQSSVSASETITREEGAILLIEELGII